MIVDVTTAALTVGITTVAVAARSHQLTRSRPDCGDDLAALCEREDAARYRELCRCLTDYDVAFLVEWGRGFRDIRVTESRSKGYDYAAAAQAIWVKSIEHGHRRMVFVRDGRTRVWSPRESKEIETMLRIGYKFVRFSGESDTPEVIDRIKKWNDPNLIREVVS